LLVLGRTSTQAPKELSYLRELDPTDNVHLVDLDGNFVQSWRIDPAQASEPTPSVSPSFVLRRQNEIYATFSTEPTIQVFSLPNPEPDLWRLKPPAGYIAPPEKRMPTERQGKPHLVSSFYEGFTYARRIVWTEQGDFLFVTWKMGKGRGFKLDVYKLPDRKLVLRGLDVPGEAVGVADDEVFIFENRDLGSGPESERPYVIHRYALTDISDN